VGSMFRHTWDNATRCAALDEATGPGRARVLILSYAGADVSG
jgi:hypothetical protein